MTLLLTATKDEQTALLKAAQAQFPALALVRSVEVQDSQLSARVGLPIGTVEVRVEVRTEPG